MASKSQIKISNPDLKWLKPAFEKLHREIDRFIKWHRYDDREGELPYADIETATISMIVGAAACAGYLGLAEYSTKKLKNGRQCNGRCDLYLAESQGDKWLEFEAKQIFVQPGSSPRRIEAALDDAVRDAKCILDKERAAIVFAVMNIPNKELPTNWAFSFAKQFKSVQSDLLWTWYDPKPKSDIYRWKSRRYPGFGIFIKLA